MRKKRTSENTRQPHAERSCTKLLAHLDACVCHLLVLWWWGVAGEFSDLDSCVHKAAALEALRELQKQVACCGCTLNQPKPNTAKTKA
eukprot:438454-Amphidinium_carterae.1